LYHREGCVWDLGFGNTEEGRGAGTIAFRESFSVIPSSGDKEFLLLKLYYQNQTVFILLPELYFRCRLTK
jgi:hypothetical protein